MKKGEDRRTIRKNRYTLFILKLNYGTNRTEYLLLHNLHVGIDVSEKRRLDEVTLSSCTLASAVHGRTFIFTGLDIAQDALPLFYQQKFNIQPDKHTLN